MNNIFGYILKDGTCEIMGVDAEYLDFEVDFDYVKKVTDDSTFVTFGQGECIYFRKGNAPLFVGLADAGYYVASRLDMLTMCKKYYMLLDGYYGKINGMKLSVYDSKHKKVKPKLKPVPSFVNIEKQDLSSAINSAFKRLTDDTRLRFDSVKISKHSLEKISRIYLTGDGSSYNVAKALALNIELLCDVQCVAIRSKALKGVAGMLDKDTLVIAISHSGESLSTISAVKRAKGYGAKTLGITNTAYSYLYFLCDNVICEPCLEEYAFCVNYFLLSLFGVYLGRNVGYMKDLHVSLCVKMAEMLEGKLNSQRRNNGTSIFNQRDLTQYKNVVFTGFGIDYGIASELAKYYRNNFACSSYAISIDDIESADVYKYDLVVAIISNNADFNVIKYELERLDNSQISFCVYACESYVKELPNIDNIVSISDSVPLFNPILLTSYIENDFDSQLDTPEDLTA